MNNIIYFPKVDLDMGLLKTIAKESKQSEGMAVHHRLVKDYEYMVEIRQQFPFLSNVFNVYIGLGDFPLHIDTARKCTLNIPIENAEYSSTISYTATNYTSVYSKEAVHNRLFNLENLVEIYRFTLDRPTLFNTQIPHRVIVRVKPRITISWSMQADINFEEAVELFNEYEQD